MASPAPRISPGRRSDVFARLAHHRSVAAGDERAARARTGEDGAGANTRRGDDRPSDGEDDTLRVTRGSDGGKRMKERKRQLLVDTQGLIHQAGLQDPCGRPIPAVATAWMFPSDAAPPGGERVCRRGIHRRGNDGTPVERATRSVGARGDEGRLGEDPALRLPRCAAAPGGGAHFCLALHVATICSRAARGLNLYRHDQSSASTACQANVSHLEGKRSAHAA